LTDNHVNNHQYEQSPDNTNLTDNRVNNHQYEQSPDNTNLTGVSMKLLRIALGLVSIIWLLFILMTINTVVGQVSIIW
jgi:hypothetical protein